MRCLFLLGLALMALGSLGNAHAQTRRKSGHITKYYRSGSHGRRNATQPPKHKDNNYSQHGWY